MAHHFEIGAAWLMETRSSPWKIWVGSVVSTGSCILDGSSVSYISKIMSDGLPRLETGSTFGVAPDDNAGFIDDVRFCKTVDSKNDSLLG